LIKDLIKIFQIFQLTGGNMIRENVTLTFDPEKSRKEIKEVFTNDLARLIWLAVRYGHVVDEHFSKDCLRCARAIERSKKAGKLTAEMLFRILSGFAGAPGQGIIGSSEKDFAAELLPFINGEKTISYEVKAMPKTQEMRRATTAMKVLKKTAEENRILLYGSDPGYHVIAGKDAQIDVGDTIQYEPYGANFGWFIQKL
jgi:hypothetical protein